MKVIPETRRMHQIR